MNKQEQRIKAQAQRRNIAADTKSRWDKQIAQHCASFVPLITSQTTGSYLATEEEVDTRLVHSSLNKDWYVPRITDYENCKMSFHQLGEPLIANRFGIDEPEAAAKSVAANELDLVLIPLLAYDLQGNRLGMGGGFYDRALAFKQTNRKRSKPLVVGLAYALQQQKFIEPEIWDVPLDAIITENGIITFET